MGSKEKIYLNVGKYNWSNGDFQKWYESTKGPWDFIDNYYDSRNYPSGYDYKYAFSKTINDSVSFNMNINHDDSLDFSINNLISRGFKTNQPKANVETEIAELYGQFIYDCIVAIKSIEKIPVQRELDDYKKLGSIKHISDVMCKYINLTKLVEKANEYLK